MFKRSFIVALLAFGLMLGTAQAGLLSIVPGSAQGSYTTPPDGGGTVGNQIIPNMMGWLGADLLLTGTAGTTYRITYQFVGNESAWNNTFTAGAGSFTSNVTLPGTSFSNDVLATSGSQLLSFSFGSMLPATVTNGTNPDNIAGGGANGNANFFVSFNPRTGTQVANLATGGFAYVALDDGGANRDDNHDDLVVLVSAQAVPDGGTTMMLLGGALLGLGALRRKFRG
jgi:hypothetical protein